MAKEMSAMNMILKKHAAAILRRWTSTYSNAKLEGLNGLFQAARARARGYRNTNNFIAIIYLLKAPIVFPKST